MTERPFISIIVPAFNEGPYIRECLQSLVESARPFECEILVMDGGSLDDTAAIVRDFARHAPHVRLLDNPARLQSAAMNAGAQIASRRAAIIVRADAHALYPKDYLRNCVDALLTRKVDSVVVPMINRGTSAMQRAVAAAQSSRLGNGGAAHRGAGASGFVEHGHHAAFDRATFLRLGGYDVRFSHNEDAEYDIRLRRAGGRIWMCREAPVWYYPRRTLRALGRQYFKHGQGRARNVLLHRLRPRLRQLAPVGALLVSVAGVLLGAFNRAFLLAPAAYAAICLGWGIGVSVRRRDAGLLAAGPAVMVMHLAWACGFLGFMCGALVRRLRPARAALPQRRYRT